MFAGGVRFHTAVSCIFDTVGVVACHICSWFLPMSWILDLSILLSICCVYIYIRLVMSGHLLYIHRLVYIIGRTHSWRFSIYFIFVCIINLTKNWKRQLWVRPMGGWNSTLQAAWYVRHAHWACLCYIPIEIRMVFVNYIYDMVVDTQFHKFYGRPFARVLYLFLMKDIGRWLPWVLPGVNRTILQGRCCP